MINYTHRQELPSTSSTHINIAHWPTAYLRRIINYSPQQFMSDQILFGDLATSATTAAYQQCLEKCSTTAYDKVLNEQCNCTPLS